MQNNGVEWSCKKCTFVNHPLMTSCEMCDNQLLTSADQKSGPMVDDPSYELMVAAEFQDLFFNEEPFECPICFTAVDPQCGVMLRECLHLFCWTCLEGHISTAENAEIECPYNDGVNACKYILQEREIRALVPKKVYEKHLRLSCRQAESQAGNRSYHCATPDCSGWCLYEPNPPPVIDGKVVVTPKWYEFRCPVCGISNCMQCRAVHTGEDCSQYQQRIQEKAINDKNAALAVKELERLLAAGEAMKCPQCSVIISKYFGCDWLVCTVCKTEICWATKQARWGPKGRGDTSGGCQCKVAGKLCHPKCQNCH